MLFHETALQSDSFAEEGLFPACTDPRVAFGHVKQMLQPPPQKYFGCVN